MGNAAGVGLSQLIGSTADVAEFPPTTAPPKRPPTMMHMGVVKSVGTGPTAELETVTGGIDKYPAAMTGSTIISELKRQIRQRDAVLERCATEIDDLRRLVATRDAEVARLKAEINKFKSVLDAKVPAGGSHSPMNGTLSVTATALGGRVKSDLLATINEEALMIGQEARLKKQGVSGESAQTGHGVHELRRFDKDFKYVQITYYAA
jgi:hypothetical protein